MWSNPGFPGERNSGELVTEPGQSLSTREIYERFLNTGRVFGGVRTGEFDSDELGGKEPDFDDIAVHQQQAIDLSDIYDANSTLIDRQKKCKDIQRLANQYNSGKFSYDEFCSRARKIDDNLSKPFIEWFGKALQLKKEDKNDTGAKNE